MSHRIGSMFRTFLALLVAPALARAEPLPVTAVTREGDVVINNGRTPRPGRVIRDR